MSVPDTFVSVLWDVVFGGHAPPLHMHNNTHQTIDNTHAHNHTHTTTQPRAHTQTRNNATPRHRNDTNIASRYNACATTAVGK